MDTAVTEIYTYCLTLSLHDALPISDLSKDLLAALNLWAAFLYAPLLEDRPQKIMGDNGSLYGAKVAGEVHKELRRLGGVTPPREFVLLDRAAIGLGSVFMHLAAEIN